MRWGKNVDNAGIALKHKKRVFIAFARVCACVCLLASGIGISWAGIRSMTEVDSYTARSDSEMAAPEGVSDSVDEGTISPSKTNIHSLQEGDVGDLTNQPALSPEKLDSSSGRNSTLIATNALYEYEHRLEENQESIPPNWAPMAIIGLSASTLVSVLISFYLYRWRKILIKSQDVLLPEELAKTIEKFSSRLRQLHETSFSSSEESRQNTSKITDAVKALGRALLTFQKSLEEKDKELDRYKKGYDAVILKRNLTGFARLALFIDAIKEESDEVTNIRLLLDDALEDCGVEKYFPEIGMNFKSAIGVEDRPKVEKVEDPSLDMKILLVERPGFRFSDDSLTNSGVILKARVVVGRYVEGEQND